MARNIIIARLLAIGFIVTGRGWRSVDPEGDDQLRHPSVGYGSVYVATNRLAANGNYRGFLDGVGKPSLGRNGALVYQDGSIELALQALEETFETVTVEQLPYRKEMKVAMDEESTRLNNFCADLVSEKRSEPFVIHLLTNTQTGEWVRVDEICAALGLATYGPEADLFAAWLADPLGNEGFDAMIVFYDNESMWTTAARYNRHRLLEEAQPQR